MCFQVISGCTEELLAELIYPYVQHFKNMVKSDAPITQATGLVFWMFKPAGMKNEQIEFRFVLTGWTDIYIFGGLILSRYKYYERGMHYFFYLLNSLFSPTSIFTHSTHFWPNSTPSSIVFWQFLWKSPNFLFGILELPIFLNFFKFHHVSSQDYCLDRGRLHVG